MKRVDLEVAVAVGLAVALPLYKIFTLPEICESPNLSDRESVALLLILAAYLSVPLLFGLLWRQRVARFVWLWIPVLGSLFSVVILYFLIVQMSWGLGLSATVWLALCVWTLPFAAIVHYCGMMIRGIRRWHEGSKENLNIWWR